MIRDDDKLYDLRQVEWGLKVNCSRGFFALALRLHGSFRIDYISPRLTLTCLWEYAAPLALTLPYTRRIII